jgi:hypothetical protein
MEGDSKLKEANNGIVMLYYLSRWSYLTTASLLGNIFLIFWRIMVGWNTNKSIHK